MFDVNMLWLLIRSMARGEGVTTAPLFVCSSQPAISARETSLELFAMRSATWRGVCPGGKSFEMPHNRLYSKVRCSEPKNEVDDDGAFTHDEFKGD